MLNSAPKTGKSKNSAKLIMLVEQTIYQEPFEFEGFSWAARAQPEWAAMLGVSVATLRRLISKPPFVREQTHNADGKRVTLLRLGESAQKTPRHLANIMAKIFRKKTGQEVGRHAFGCLVGCAEIWPNDHQIEIFKLTLNEWSTFMEGFRLAIDVGEIKPPSAKTYSKPVPYMKWQFPHIPTIRLGATVALELYQMQWQEKLSSKPKGYGSA